MPAQLCGVGISQRMLAYSIGRDRQAIQRLEAGNTNPTYLILHEIAVVLGVEVDFLISGGKKSTE